MYHYLTELSFDGDSVVLLKNETKFHIKTIIVKLTCVAIQVFYAVQQNNY